MSLIQFFEKHCLRQAPDGLGGVKKDPFVHLGPTWKWEWSIVFWHHWRFIFANINSPRVSLTSIFPLIPNNDLLTFPLAFCSFFVTANAIVVDRDSPEDVSALWKNFSRSHSCSSAWSEHFFLSSPAYFNFKGLCWESMPVNQPMRQPVWAHFVTVLILLSFISISISVERL